LYTVYRIFTVAVTISLTYSFIKNNLPCKEDVQAAGVPVLH